VTETTAGDILARVYRGDGLEAIHCGSVAVVNGAGELTHYVGDPRLTIMTRSSIKPFQLMPLLGSGAADHYGFEPRQLAIMCGSHNGSDDHRAVVAGNLEKSGSAPTDLQCGTHWPIGMQIGVQYPVNGEDQDPLRHNCSGKHSGFLALARFLGDEPGEYLNPASKAQQAVRANLASFCEYDESKLTPGIDGCSAPNYPLPLYNLALGYKKLANLDASDAAGMQVLARIKGAMTEFPEMVSGEGRFDLDLALSFPGNLICKVGAESLEAIGLSDPALGIAVKIHDGNDRALAAICIEVLRQLGVIDDIEKYPLLKRHVRPEVRNNRNLLTGHVVTEFTLKRA